MDKKNTSSENIAEALELLEEAAEQKKDELKSVMSDKYLHLKGMIMETENGFVKTLNEVKTHAVHAVMHAKEVGTEKGMELARDVDKNVHSTPWPYIGGAAVVSLLLGFLLGRNRN